MLSVRLSVGAKRVPGTVAGAGLTDKDNEVYVGGGQPIITDAIPEADAALPDVGMGASDPEAFDAFGADLAMDNLGEFSEAQFCAVEDDEAEISDPGSKPTGNDDEQVDESKRVPAADAKTATAPSKPIKSAKPRPAARKPKAKNKVKPKQRDPALAKSKNRDATQSKRAPLPDPQEEQQDWEQWEPRRSSPTPKNASPPRARTRQQKQQRRQPVAATQAAAPNKKPSSAQLRRERKRRNRARLAAAKQQDQKTGAVDVAADADTKPRASTPAVVTSQKTVSNATAAQKTYTFTQDELVAFLKRYDRIKAQVCDSDRIAKRAIAELDA